MLKIKEFVNIFFSLRRKIQTNRTFKKYQLIKEELENQKLNRDYIGLDRDGNKYYQYYSYFGLPTKREIDFKDRYNIHIQDLAYFDWLTGRQAYAPTELELEYFYFEVNQRKILGQKWDDEEEQLMQSFYKQQQIVQQQNQEKQQIQQQIIFNQDSQADEIQKEIQSKEFINQKEQEQNIDSESFQPGAWTPKNKVPRKQQQ